MAKQKEKTRYEQLLEKLTDPKFIAEQNKKIQDLGLIEVLAYHCNRCNYLWFAKDFDLGENILELEPPKACARCKSKYWNKKPVRKTGQVYSDKYGMHHLLLSIPRYRALHRKGKLDFKVPNCNCKYCNAINAKEGKGKGGKN
jgi:hypothetical protein